MGLLIELEPAVEEALAREAEREGVSPSALAARILSTVASMGRNARELSPQGPVDGSKTNPIESPSVPPGRQANRVSAWGKYAHLGLSSDEFAREKQEEIDFEERKYRR